MSQDDKPYAKAMTTEQRHYQQILTYVRDEIIDPIMPPVKKLDKKLNMWFKSRDHVLIDRLAKRHTDELIRLCKEAKQ